MQRQRVVKGVVQSLDPVDVEEFYVTGKSKPKIRRQARSPIRKKRTGRRIRVSITEQLTGEA